MFYKSPLEAVAKAGQKLTSARFANNLTVVAEQWIDASYEGGSAATLRAVPFRPTNRLSSSSAHRALPAST